MITSFRPAHKGISHDKLRPCNNCDAVPTTRDKPFLMCSRCKVIPYCSKECQKEAWKVHKPACDYGCDEIPRLNAQSAAEHPDYVPDPRFPPHKEYMNLCSDFLSAYSWSLSQTVNSAVLSECPLEEFPVDEYCIIMRFKYQPDCGGDPSRAFRIEEACFCPLEVIKKTPMSGWLEATRLEREARATRNKVDSRFVSAIIVLFFMDDAPRFHEFVLMHPHPMFKMLGHKRDIAFHKVGYERFGRLSDKGVVFMCSNDLEGGKPGLIRMERSKWRWKEMTEAELEDNGYPIGFKGSPDLVLPGETILLSQRIIDTDCLAALIHLARDKQLWIQVK